MGCEEHFQTFYRASDHTGFWLLLCLCFFIFSPVLLWKAPCFICFCMWNIVFCFVLKLYIWSVPYALCNPLRDGLWVFLSEDWHIERVAVFVWVLWRTTSPLHYPDVPAQKSFAVTMEAEVRKRKGENEAAVTLINVWWPFNCVEF